MSIDTIECPNCGATNDYEAVRQQECCHDCREEIKPNACPVCNDRWTWANPIAENTNINVEQAAKVCIGEEGLYVHNHK